MNSKNFTAPAPTFGLILTTGLGIDNKLNHSYEIPAFLEHTHLVQWGSHPSAPGHCWRGQRAGDDRNLPPRNTFTSHLSFRWKESLVPAGSPLSIKPPIGALQPRDQASTPLPSFMWNIPVVGGEGRSAVCQGCPQAPPATVPGKHWAELVRQPPTPLPSYQRLRVPRDRFNLPNTKKLKCWNAVGFFPEYISWVLEVTLRFYLYNIINAIMYI